MLINDNVIDYMHYTVNTQQCMFRICQFPHGQESSKRLPFRNCFDVEILSIAYHVELFSLTRSAFHACGLVTPTSTMACAVGGKHDEDSENMDGRNIMLLHRVNSRDEIRHSPVDRSDRPPSTTADN